MSLLRPDAFLSPLEIEAAVTRALEEDLGRAGDITSTATVPEDAPGRAVLNARQAGVIAGLPLVAASFKRLSPDIEIVPHARDGATIAARTKLMTISGNARAILGAERVALNFLGHLSGIATATAEFVHRIAHTKARVICTRKTTPGLRALEKYAVRCGGGYNHRFGLDDAMLIKDNHIAVAGGIAAVLKRAKAAAGHLVKIEIEVDSLDQLKEVLDVGLADVVLIDNFDLEAMRKAVAMVAGRLVIEASGGITLESPRRSPKPASIICRRARSPIRCPISTSDSISRCDRCRHCEARCRRAIQHTVRHLDCFVAPRLAMTIRLRGLHALAVSRRRSGLRAFGRRLRPWRRGRSGGTCGAAACGLSAGVSALTAAGLQVGSSSPQLRGR